MTLEWDVMRLLLTILTFGVFRLTGMSGETPVLCTWHLCRELRPSWHIQNWKSSPYTGPSWWPPTTHPLCSHWTLGWTGPPCWNTKHTHNSIKFWPVEWLNSSIWLVRRSIVCTWNLGINNNLKTVNSTLKEPVNAQSWYWICIWTE